MPNQCFGLGPERGLNGAVNPEVHLTTEQCAEECCKSSECEMWQQQEGRGCYFNKKDGIWCTEATLPTLEGARKCIPNYCGTPEMEASILAAYHAGQLKLGDHTNLRHGHGHGHHNLHTQ